MGNDDHERDAAVEAFEGVRGELALLRRAIEGIAVRDDQPEPPDYTEMLGQITKLATGTYQRAEILRKAAEEETVARQVAARITGAVAEDRQAVKAAAGELRDATRALQGITALARRAEDQKWWLVRTAIAGIAVGMILWAVFAGIVVRAVPSSWRWPERMAAVTLNRPMWEAGAQLMQASSPGSYASMVMGDKLAVANRDALTACRKQAVKAYEAVRCTIRVEAE